MFQQNFFEDIAIKHPNLIAVDDHGKKISYKKLNIYANKLANLILKFEFHPNDRICILTKKNINLYASLLAVVKSGGCWVPLSDQFPKERINYLINLTSPKFIIIEKEFVHFIKKKSGAKIIVINENKKSNIFLTKRNILIQKSSTPEIKDLNSSNLAYIIYTSGSTGNPKGVMVSHLNTSSYILNSKKYFKIKPKMRFAHISEIIFDPSIFDIFVCWHNKGTVVPMNKKEYKINFIEFFKKNKNINICFVVPSFFQKLKDLKKLNSKYLKKLKHVVFGGELLTKELLTTLFKELPKTNFYNVYGTTETAIISHWHRLTSTDLKLKSLPVGKQIPQINTILIKDNNYEAKINETGNAHVYGVQVSKGYWKSNFLNNKYFINNPTKKQIFEKLYNTGDILYKNEDETFFYYGRQDSQIKVRGSRVEIEEIENIFRSNPFCKDICVIPCSRDNSKIFTDLIYYIRPHEKIKKKKEYFFTTAKKILPNFMQPTNIIIIHEDFPRNINGKIDKKELIKKFFTKIA